MTKENEIVEVSLLNGWGITDHYLSDGTMELHIFLPDNKLKVLKDIDYYPNIDDLPQDIKDSICYGDPKETKALVVTVTGDVSSNPVPGSVKMKSTWVKDGSNPEDGKLILWHIGKDKEIDVGDGKVKNHKRTKNRTSPIGPELGFSKFKGAITPSLLDWGVFDYTNACGNLYVEVVLPEFMMAITDVVHKRNTGGEIEIIEIHVVDGIHSTGRPRIFNTPTIMFEDNLRGRQIEIEVRYDGRVVKRKRTQSKVSNTSFLPPKK